MKIGIIGLPLSGKSTVFNALTGLNAEVKEFSSGGKTKPNLGAVKIPDEKLQKLADIFKPKKITPATIDFVDMVGISKDAKAEEIDLTPIKDTDALVCVIRFFKNDKVPHPYGDIDGVRDLRVINTELILLDLNVVETRIERIQKELQRGKKENQKELDMLKKCQEHLSKEKPLRELKFDSEQNAMLRGFQLLSKKPMLALANIDEGHIKTGEPDRFAHTAEGLGISHIAFCGKVEAEIARLDDEELKSSFMQDLGITETARGKFIKANSSLLDLITFYTVKGEESKAWLIERGSTTYVAAGKIHSDIQRGFIKAELVNFKELTACDFDMNKVKSEGKLKLEGKDYIVEDGDIIYFRFSV
ncbi:MAG: redox-regulated ATPase YchF [Candidatus Omnitrophota bacterium]|nr:MAG: redox-regulated ATPase YchF [Candidatus Omnitrophota bacterium]